jgi:hypothetical protein
MGYRLPAATRKAMTMRWHLLLLSARPRRAILETLLVGTMMWIGLLLLHQQVPSFILQLGISLLIGPSCMLLCALRLQILSGSWQRQGVIDVTFAALSGLVLSSMTLVYILVLLQSGTENPLWRGTYRPYLLATIALGLDIAMFVITRIGLQTCHPKCHLCLSMRIVWSRFYATCFTIACATHHQVASSLWW